MRERVISVVILLTIATIVSAVAWSSGAVTFVPPHPAHAFDLTGVGASGVWTLEPVTGLNYWWKRFPRATLFVETGDEVVLHLRSADVFHRLYIPEFGVGPVDVEPGHTVTVRVKASRAGVFQYYCTSMCGTCHFFMRGWIVVTDPGQPRVEPPPLVCAMCTPSTTPLPAEASVTERGAWLYEQKGCVTCHGLEGRGGVANANSTSRTVPAHDTTAQKLFLRSPEDAEAFIDLLEHQGDLRSVGDSDIAAFPAVSARFENAKEIVRKGRYTAKADPQGPHPPLQMPAWQYLLDERDVDALLAYFVSLDDRDSEEGV